jgi:hypothetical protein
LSIFKPVLENVWKFGIRIAEEKLPFAENAGKFSKKKEKIFKKNGEQKKI